MTKYCLDANFFIEAWNKYYSPHFCSGYWDVIENLGKSGIVFVPERVQAEIEKQDDELSGWLKSRPFLIQSIDEPVQRCMRELFAKDERHHRLVDSMKGRSEADPWVIAHAMANNATVVTKENKESNVNSPRIKIPNVCENMGVRWIDDFTFIREMSICFNCTQN